MPSSKVSDTCSGEQGKALQETGHGLLKEVGLGGDNYWEKRNDFVIRILEVCQSCRWLRGLQNLKLPEAEDSSTYTVLSQSKLIITATLMWVLDGSSLQV